MTGGGHCGGEEGAYDASYDSFSVVIVVWPFFFVVGIGIVGCVEILLLLLVVGSIAVVVVVVVVVVVAVVVTAADNGIAQVAYGIAAFYGSIIIIDSCTVVCRNVPGWHILSRCFPWARTPIVIASIRQSFQFPQQTIIIIITIFIIILTTPTLLATPTLRTKK